MKTNLTIGIPVWLDKICARPVLWYRKCKYGYTYRRIPLGEDRFTIVEPRDFYRYNNFNWCPNENGPNNYAVRLVTICKKGEKSIKLVSLHREIMKHPKGLFVDHKNGDGLDNRRANLRVATRSQNMCNVQKRKNTSSRFIGVCFHKRNKLWAVRIQYRGKGIWLGYFEDEIEAARVYDRAAIKYHGEFARLNFPREDYKNENCSSNCE